MSENLALELGTESDLKYYHKLYSSTQGGKVEKFSMAFQATVSRARAQGYLDMVTIIVKRILDREDVPRHKWMPFIRLGQSMAGMALRGEWYKISEAAGTAINRNLESSVVDEMAEIFGEKSL